jgi:hypothetical protein
MKRRHAAPARRPPAYADAPAEADASFIVPGADDRLSVLTTRTRATTRTADMPLPEPEMRPMDAITYHRMNSTFEAIHQMSSRAKRSAFAHIRDESVDHNSFFVSEGHFVGMICISSTLESQSRTRKLKSQSDHVDQLAESLVDAQTEPSSFSRVAKNVSI